MKIYPALRRLLAAVSTFVILALVLWFLVPSAQSIRSNDERSAPAKTAEEHNWPMFGGSPSRNMVNTFEKNVPTEWSVEEGAAKNIKWSADLGSKAYGGPVIADGKVFVGTNNGKRRNPKIKGDKGIVMCFDEKTGKFLWQAVHDKLPAGLVNDWPQEGICSTPAVEGKRIYYVSNRCELVCAD